MALSLRKNFGFALIGNLVYAACQYVILLIFIKLFSVEDVGVFVYAGAFTTPLMLALDMQLRNFYITDGKREMSLNDYLTFRTFFNLLGVVGLFVAASVIKPEYRWIILLVSLLKFLESQMDLLYGVYQRGHHLDFVAYSRILRGVLAVVIVAVVSFAYTNLVYSLIAYFLSWVLLYFFYERRQLVRRGFANFKDLRLTLLSKRKMKILLVLCAPMFFSIFIDKYYLNYPRLSVEAILGVKMLGIFGSLLYFKSIGGQFISSLAQASIPKLSNYVADRKIKPFNGLLFKMILMGFGVGVTLSIAAYLGGRPLIEFLYSREYAKYSDVLSVILLGATVTFSYIFIATALTCIRKQWVKLPLSIVSFLTLFFMIKFSQINSLMDVAVIVLCVEVLTFVLYYSVYIFFVRRQVRNWNSISFKK